MQVLPRHCRGCLRNGRPAPWGRHDVLRIADARSRDGFPGRLVPPHYCRPPTRASSASAPCLQLRARCNLFAPSSSFPLPLLPPLPRVPSPPGRCPPPAQLTAPRSAAGEARSAAGEAGVAGAEVAGAGVEAVDAGVEALQSEGRGMRPPPLHQAPPVGQGPWEGGYPIPPCPPARMAWGQCSVGRRYCCHPT